MERIIYISFILLVAVGSSYATLTYIQQDITEDTTWTKSDSPIIIYGNVSVDNGAILTIEHGVEVLFEVVIGDGGFREGSELYVKDGTLLAMGIEMDPVIFSSNATLPSPGDWGCVVVEDDSIISLNNCTIEYAKVGLYFYDLDYFSEIASDVESCLFRYNDEYGVFFYQCSPTLRYNEFTENSVGVRTLGNSTPLINYNDIYDNYVYNYRNDSANNQDATCNWWGTTNPSIIELKIYDELDDPSKGRVDYVPYLSGPAGHHGTVQIYSMGWVKSYFW